MKLSKLVFLIVPFLFFACTTDKEDDKHKVEIGENFETSIKVPIGENSWLWNTQTDSFETEDQDIITEEGIRHWEDPEHAIKSYVRVKDTGRLHLALNVKKALKGAQIKVSLEDQSTEINLDDTREDEAIKIGTFHVDKPGYQTITLDLGNKKNVAINELALGGAATREEVNFVEDNFHFGRRGPSVHLNYPMPSESKKPIYFYNEIKVPEGEDVVGSYFMADGFSHGYFGMQVNSENERRVLFSVWSPYDTEDPEDIPEDQRIELLEQGDHVHVGKFGNEGSGGQSYKNFMWKPETTYKFLLKGEPADDTHTDYAAYFYDPDESQWQLIATFRRPKSGGHLSDLYSFLENFQPSKGNVSRKAMYKNQWIYDDNEGWIPLKKAEFTGDETATQKDRLDYAGGEVKGGYFLKNGGFFDDKTELNSGFTREAKEDAPDIDFDALPED